MAAASISKTSVAVAAAITNYVQNRMDSTPPLSQPLTITRGYVSRYGFTEVSWLVCGYIPTYSCQCMLLSLPTAGALPVSRIAVLHRVHSSAWTAPAFVGVFPRFPALFRAVPNHCQHCCSACG